jgi:hypothetical protein
MKNALVLLAFAFGIFISFAATAPKHYPTEGNPVLTKTELKAERAFEKSQEKAIKAEAKAERKAKRAAKYIAWWKSKLKTKAGDINIAAVVLCFFFGWFGIHRVIMGGTPLLILGYLLTFGGLFGILVLIDFIRLIIDSSHYQDSDRLFRAFEN